MQTTRHFIFSLVIVILSLVSVDILIGKIGDFLMDRIPNFSGQLAKDNYRLNRVTDDIIILGSSRGSHHYVTTMLKDSINNYTGRNYSLYNAAIDGKFINSNLCAAESIMSRYSPKLLIFEVSESELSGSEAVQDIMFSAVHYHKNPFVKQYIQDLGRKEQIKVASNMFRYNQKFLRIFSSFIQKGEKTGYEPLYKVMTIIPKQGKENLKNVKPIKVDEYSLTNFTRVMRTARDKGVQLVVVSSPTFSPIVNNDYLASLCKDYKIPYLDLYNLELFNNHPEYFQDIGHLNDTGAHIYTDLFFKELKPYLLNLENVVTSNFKYTCSGVEHHVHDQ